MPDSSSPREIVYRTRSRTLTAAELAKIAVPPGVKRLTVKDTEVPGLELRLSATGARAWAVSRRVDGRQRRYTIANGDRLSLAEARRAAIRMLAEIEAGRDPVAERREKRRAAKLLKLGVGKVWTLGELIDEFGVKVAVPAGQRSWAERRTHVRREYKTLLDMPAAQITEAMLWHVLEQATARGAKIAGRHGLRYLRTVCRWATKRGLIPSDPTTDIPLADVTKYVGKERERDRVLSADELARLWRGWEGEPFNAYSAIFRMILLTAQRLSEVATMRWQDVDAERAEWVQTSNKSGRRHVVPLSAEALAILRMQPRRGERIFTTTTGGTLDHRSGNWSRETTRYAEAARVEHWTRHDLRRTAATVLAELGTDPLVIEVLLNHAEAKGRVGRIYNRHSYQPELRAAVERLARHVRSLAEGGTGEVIEMRPRRQEPGG